MYQKCLFVRTIVGTALILFGLIENATCQSGVKKFLYKKRAAGIVQVDFIVRTSDGKNELKLDKTDNEIDLNQLCDIKGADFNCSYEIVIRLSNLRLGLKERDFKGYKHKAHESLYRLEIPISEDFVNLTPEGLKIQNNRTIKLDANASEPEELIYKINSKISKETSDYLRFKFKIVGAAGRVADMGEHYDARIQNMTRKIEYSIIPNTNFLNLSKRINSANQLFETIKTAGDCSDFLVSQCRDFLNLYGDLNKDRTNEIRNLEVKCSQKKNSSKKELAPHQKLLKKIQEANNDFQDDEEVIRLCRQYLNRFKSTDDLQGYKYALTLLGRYLPEGKEREEVFIKYLRSTDKKHPNDEDDRRSSNKKVRKNDSDSLIPLPIDTNSQSDTIPYFIPPPIKDLEPFQGVISSTSDGIVVTNIQGGEKPYTIKIFKEPNNPFDGIRVSDEFRGQNKKIKFSDPLFGDYSGAYYASVFDDNNNKIASDVQVEIEDSFDLSWVYILLLCSLGYGTYFIYKKYFTI